ncbi:MAG TPA: SIMPL domain-containing protein [Hyphomicrobiaceae bacterium]|nr:SIMPL domain-containing protein [Hyphomicrobiaceae bacterium]
MKPMVLKITAMIWVALAATSIGGFAHAADKPRTLSISATASVAAEPDIATFTTGVVTEEATAKKALAGNSEAMRRVLDGLKRAGVAAKDIQTMQFNVQARYNNPKRGDTQEITGYAVTNQIVVAVREVARLGELLDLSIGLGANRMGSIQFDVSDLELKQDDARRQAVQTAIRRAKLYALASSEQLGPILTIRESVHQPRGQHQRGAGRMAMAMAAPIAPGQLEYEVTVNIVWALK